MQISLLQKKRLEYQPAIPSILRDLRKVVLREKKGKGNADEALQRIFPKTNALNPFYLDRGEGKNRPLRIGAVFSGGQASGGHNVLAGIFDALQQFDHHSELFGFLGGPSGIVENRWKKIEERELKGYRNQGGFDLIGSGRTKIETDEQLKLALASCEKNRLDGLIVIGGDDSNTNAAILAEYFLTAGCQTKVVGVPKTIDGDLRSREIEISFGFDTACKTYAELIGNIARDALSAKKYYHFIKLMGRSASHITLECALATHPNLALIGEEGKGIDAIVKEIADLICRRKDAGKEYGVILIPEGLIEFIPEIKELISELNRHLAAGKTDADLSDKSRKIFQQFPEKIQKQLLLDRDPHGNVQVSLIATEQLLIDLVKKELKKRGDYKGKFSAQDHFFGYEGRAAMPSNFDANYCYSLGLLAALCVRDGATGVIGSVQHVTKPVEEWEVQAVPLVKLIHFEMRKGKEKPVIQKTLVDIKQGPFVYFARLRKSWEIEDQYRYPGPIQFFGERALTDSVPLTLLELNDERGS